MCKVISLLQKKGGAAKTTTAINLLGALMEQGFKTILCDMDKEKPDALYWSDMGTELVNFVIPLVDENPKIKITELKKSYDFIVIDTPPNFEASALKAAMLCDLAIIPCSASRIEQNALEEAATCAIMAEKPYRFLASRITKNTNLSKQFLTQLQETGLCFATSITNSVAMMECQSKGTWVGAYAPQQANHLQYQALANEIITILEISL